MEKEVENKIKHSNGLCCLCNRNVLLDSNTSTSINDNAQKHQTMAHHYIQCMESFKQILNNTYFATTQPKEDEDEEEPSSNHFFNDSLLKVTLLPIFARDDDNESLMNLLMTCKDAYKWKHQLVFPRVPSIDIINYYDENSMIDQLPTKYRRVYINNIEEWEHLLDNPYGLITETCNELYFTFDIVIEDGDIPDHFTKIHLGDEYSGSDDMQGIIPPDTTHLYIGKSFNGLLKKEDLPDSLIWLDIFSSETRLEADEQTLPPNIETLTISTNQILGPYLGKSMPKLKSLNIKTIDDDESVLEPGMIPDTVVFLNVTMCELEDGAIPHSVKNLTIDLSYNVSSVIPPSVTHLQATFNNGTIVTQGMIPSTVVELELEGDYSLEEGCIPSSVVVLSLMDLTENPPPNTIPNSVTYLFLRGNTDCQFDGSQLPSSIKYFGIQDSYPYLLADTIPPSTKYFDYQNEDCHGIKYCRFDIPESVTHFRIGVDNGNPFPPDFLPSNLEYLQLVEVYRQKLPTKLPTTLKTIECNPFNSKVGGSVPTDVLRIINCLHRGTLWNNEYKKYWDHVVWHLDI